MSRATLKEVNAALRWLETLREKGPQPVDGSLTMPCPDCMRREGCRAARCLRPQACICRGPMCAACRQRDLFA